LTAYGNDPNTQIEKLNLGQIVLRVLGRFTVCSRGERNRSKDLTGLTVAGCKLG
jgi:hypothetical protein